MKKSLLALAVLGAFAGAASAQSSVTIYGIVDTGFTSIDNGGAKNTAKDRINGISSGNDGASRFGFKGAEDLGNGLKAEFTLEQGFDSDTGGAKTGTAFSRLSFVGLDGGFGKVRLGRQNTQVKDMLGQVDPFGASGIANSVDFINGGGLDQRNPNQIVWLSNNYSGFSGGAAYQFGETAGSTSANSGWSARLGYANGPLNVQFGYQNANFTDATRTVNADQKNALLGATYDFGGFKLHGIYGEKKTENGYLGAAADDKIRSYLIGATVPFGANKIRAEYVRNNDRNVDNADSNLWALSYTYAMSKRTELYATYVRTGNDNLSALGVGGPGEGTLGENSNGVALGIQHKF